jgi:hypothetical protein
VRRPSPRSAPPETTSRRVRAASDCYQDQLLTNLLTRTRVHCIRLRTGASTLATTSRFATPRSAACRSPFIRSLRSPPRSSPKVLPRYRLAYILAPSIDGYAFAGWRELCLFLLALSALVSASCNFPRDPRGTLEGVQNATMRVGIVDNDPWTRMEDRRASGIEVELLKDFARELGRTRPSCRALHPSCSKRPKRPRWMY